MSAKEAMITQGVASTNCKELRFQRYDSRRLNTRNVKVLANDCPFALGFGDASPKKSHRPQRRERVLVTLRSLRLKTSRELEGAESKSKQDDEC